MRYENYHKHSWYSNISTLDCVCSPKAYIDRAIELNQRLIFSTEHGFQGNIFLLKDLIDKKNKELEEDKKLKLVVGAEIYYVDDISEKERKNYHLIIIAKNNNGAKQINKLVSLANIDGFYYKARIDKDMLFKICNPKDVIVTSACVGGLLGRDDYKKIVKEFKLFFGDNFLLEVQNHNQDIQKEVNKRALELSEELNIKIIHANDSHYIKPSDSKYRDLFLKAKGIKYPEEDNFILDYPSSEEIIDRYIEQGTLNYGEIITALKNTLVFDECEEITYINEEIKLPSISKNPKKEFDEIIAKEWAKEKKNIPKNRIKEYEEAIKFESDIVHNTNMEDYFILNYYIIKKAVEEYGGFVTRTGRGSAVSFYINKLFGFTDIDRLTAPVKLYPTRFMSETRILQTKSLPDIDMNVSSQEEFIKATEDLLGKENCAWMVSFKPLQNASAFRLYCKATGLNIDDYNEIAKELDKYKEHPKWKDIIKESEHFVGVVESISPSPCSILVFNKAVDEEIGIIKTKDGYCCLLDGYYCDKYKYLKNDILKVSVWEMIKDICELANIPIPTIKELEKLLDMETYKIYDKGLTCTVNQADSEFATNLIKEYKPRSVDEICAFVAGIRPGFASLLQNFIHRKPYTTHVQELDELLEESYHYLMYQESIMSYLIWLGIPEDETYGIIKKIAKKKFEEKELHELQEILKSNWINKVGSEEGFLDTWQVINDAVRYAFNASHSLAYAYDSLYCAYLKSHYPLEYYTICLNLYEGDMGRTPRLIDECKSFNISIRQPQFGYSKAEYFLDRDNNAIYKGVGSVKYMNEETSNILYILSQNKHYETFTDILIDSKKRVDMGKIEKLIKIQYFKEYGDINKLLYILDLFNKKGDKSRLSKVNDIELYLLYKDIIKNHTIKETAKQIVVDYPSIIRDIELIFEAEPIKDIDKIRYEIEYTGGFQKEPYSNANPKSCLVTSVKTWKNESNIELFCLKSGNTKQFRISNDLFYDNPISEFDEIYLYDFYKKPKKAKINNKWEVIVGQYNYYITDYDIMSKMA